MRRHAVVFIVVLVASCIAFLGGRRAHAWYAHRDASKRAATAAVQNAPLRSTNARTARIAELLNDLTAKPLSPQERAILATTAEPSEVAVKRRLHVLAEIDQKALNLSSGNRELVVRESDRLASNKRQLRAAFLLGQISEEDYIEALKDDVRAAVAAYEESFTDQEFEALTGRIRGTDPFSMESLAKRGVPERGDSCNDAIASSLLNARGK
jgi:hypothetical protein